ncbi:MAG: ATP-binding cassette domain-containing protein [Bacteroidota bacterium]
MKTLTVSASKSFGKRIILDDLQLNLQQGEIIGLFGRNGSGKSTLFKIIFGTLKADKVKIQIDSTTYPQKQIIPQKLIGYLPQDSFLPKRIAVRDLIPMYFQDEERLDKIFYAPKVSSFETLSPEELSKGQLKYLQVLLIAYLEHPFLMLDEPFAMIEPLYKDLLKDFLRDLKTHKGLIVSDHYYQDVLEITDKNFLLKEGKLHAITDQKELNAYGYLTKDQVR